MEDKKPHWFKDHEASDLRLQGELLAEIKALREEMKPLLELYSNGNGTIITITWVLKFVAIIGAGVTAFLVLTKKI